MPFAVTTKTKIIKYQAYTLNTDYVTAYSLSQLIDQQMSAIESDLPDLIPVIEADLVTLDTLDAALTTEQGSTSAMLRKADVVEWDTSRSKTSGIEQRFEAIRARVAQLLSQSMSTPAYSGGWGMGTLDRG